MKNYYQILRVSPEADATEIKKSYRQLANEFHPDKNDSPAALAIFQEINEAYEVLGNRQQRQLYDLRRTYPDYVPPAPNAAPQPRRPPAAYRAQRRVYLDLRPYVTYTRIVCKVSLAFCVLLMLDYVLPRQTEEEPIVEIRIYKRQNRMVVFTPHHHYTIEERIHAREARVHAPVRHRHARAAARTCLVPVEHLRAAGVFSGTAAGVVGAGGVVAGQCRQRGQLRHCVHHHAADYTIFGVRPVLTQGSQPKRFFRTAVLG